MQWWAFVAATVILTVMAGRVEATESVCGPGQFETEIDSNVTGCDDCSTGTFTDESALTTCKECGLG